METNELEIVFLQLKYCERCGGLWLRQQGETHVYCGPCARQVAAFAGSGGRDGGGHWTAKQVFGRPRNDGQVLVVCSEGGNA